LPLVSWARRCVEETESTHHASHGVCLKHFNHTVQSTRFKDAVGVQEEDKRLQRRLDADITGFGKAIVPGIANDP